MMDVLENEEDADELQGIFVEPPATNVQSDEDSGDEDSGGLIDNLASRQLRSRAIACFRSGRRIGEEEDDDVTHLSQKRKAQKLRNASWIKEDLLTIRSNFPEANYTTFSNKSPTQLFEKTLY